MIRRLLGVIVLVLVLLEAGCGGSGKSILTIAVKSGTTLPTMVASGGTTTAYFTVTNQLPYSLGATIQEIPENVTQVTSDGTYSDTCTATTTLAAGGSCTLQLTISGPVTTSERIVACRSANLCVQAFVPSDVLELSSIAISPEAFDGIVGDTEEYTATGTFSDDSTSDITTSVTWNSSNEAVATIDEEGWATAVANGSSTITATYDVLTSNESTVTVGSEATLSSIAITPTSADLDINSNSTQQFIATGTYSDASTADITSSVTWSVSPSYAATISDAGLLTAEVSVDCEVTAALDSITSNTASVTISP